MSCRDRTKYISDGWVRRNRWARIAATLSAVSFAATLGAQTPAMPQPQLPIPVPIPQQPPVPQQPVIPSQPVVPPPTVAGYRAPAIALVQPTPGQTLSPDKAVLIFRFTTGEVSDPIDVRSFAVWVNGVERSDSFQVAGTEAWGPVSDPGTSSPAVGAYQVAARICSTRGACGSTTATVNIGSSEQAPPSTTSRKEKLLDLLMSGLRRLLGP